MDESLNGSGRAEFPSTCWTLVVLAQGGEAAAAREALAGLCRAYWYPIFAYIRRRGHSPQDAQDLTQGFFVKLLETDALTRVSPEKGRFRAYLLACCKNFLCNERDRDHAAKRGGGRPLLSIDIDLDDAERRYRNEPVDRMSAEVLFERRWALMLVDRARNDLESEFAASGKSDLFRPLMAGLVSEPGAPRYARIGESLGLSESAVKKAAQRFRARFGVLLRQHVAETVADPSEVDDEVRELLRVLGN